MQKPLVRWEGHATPTTWKGLILFQRDLPAKGTGRKVGLGEEGGCCWAPPQSLPRCPNTTHCSLQLTACARHKGKWESEWNVPHGATGNSAVQVRHTMAAANRPVPLTLSHRCAKGMWHGQRVQAKVGARSQKVPLPPPAHRW